MMYDLDVFAVITAHDQMNKAGSAFELEHNSKWFRKATGGVAVEPTINSRETTPAEDYQSDKADKEQASTVSRLVVSFEKLLALDNLQSGLQLGTNPISSHVLLGHRGTKGISGRQVGLLPLDNVFSILGYVCAPPPPVVHICVHTSNVWPSLTRR